MISHIRKLFLASVFFVMNPTAIAKTGSSVEQVGSLNRIALIDGGMGYGSFGGEFGMSTVLSQNKSRDRELQLNKVFAFTGLPIGGDIGVSAGAADEYDAQHIGILGQVPIYRQARMPSIAGRLGGSRLYFGQDDNISTLQAELAIGYSILGIFTVTGNGGFLHHTAKVDQNQSESSLSLRNDDANRDGGNAETYHTYYSLGATTRLFTPFLNLGAEWTIQDSGSTAFAAKLSLSM